ncbi:E3 ubiquitin-protein ligase RHF2A-like isoform X2 [Silene latifolia]|uniref:E3 ubiquitin-protein ligase RHF2A-like isoform X2 n=1 Tax=Silene latifolia TaxID=37657 RepID=UPI003D77E229
MEATKKTDDRMTSPAAFVEGGVQEACDDACSICLEDFSQSDPSTVTNCKHEFHLQCILEWCQRSSNCPMCWQAIGLRDAMSQQLLEAVEEERNITSNRLRNAAMFGHPSLVDFDLRHALQLPVGASEADLEEHIFQHLAAAVGRGRHISRREGQGNRSSSQRQRPVFIFSAPNVATSNAVWTSTNPVAESESYRNSAEDQVPTISPSRPQIHQASFHRVASNVSSVDQLQTSRASQSSQGSRETEELSDLQSLSESMRSRLNTWSMRYKESISRNTRGWKERFFARSTSMADVGSEVRRAVPSGFASVSRLMDRFDVGSRHAVESSNSSSRIDPSNLENQVIHMRQRGKAGPASTANTTSD